MKILFILLMALSVSAHAKGGFNDPSTNGIVTPDQAVSMRSFTSWSTYSDGSFAICAKGDFTARQSCAPNEYVRITAVIPSGRTYVGFRVVRGSSARSYLEIYWK